MNFITSYVVNIDLWVNNFFYISRNDLAIKIFEKITWLGEAYVVIILALLVSIFLWLAHKRWQVIAFWVTLVGAEGITLISKLFFNRPRPDNAVLLETSGSFPSNHATLAVAFYGFIAYLLLSQIKNKLYRFLIILITVVIIFVIGFSRLYLGVHYLSDVCVGYLVGLAWLLIGVIITKKIKK